MWWAAQCERRSGAATPTTWDLTTSALPAQTEAVFAGERVIETGLRHGTVTVLLAGLPLEITTFRVDGDYSDHRRPDTVRFARSLREDLSRRDFTMNALAYRPRDGVTDLFGGAADLRAGLVRCVGDPDRRFQEDALRMLRALRFAAVLRMTVEPATAAAIRRNRALLAAVARERVREELTRLLCGPDAARVLADFPEVIAELLPELRPCFRFDQCSPYHDRDVWAHTLAALDAAPAEPVLRWAALLHDLGKPGCFTRDAGGTGHFYGHGARSAALADGILRRLRFDTAARERIVLLVRHHDEPILPERQALRRLLNRLGPEAARQLLALHRADTLGQAACCRPRLAQYAQAEALIDALLAEDACFSLRDLALNGRDLLALGLRGPAVGAALEACLQAVIEERVPNERSALLALVRRSKNDF